MSKSDLPVLLVDDEPQILLSYEAMLLAEGIENILSITDSRKVLPLLSEQKISALVLDLNMPYISGLEMLDKIHNEFRHIPVIIITAVNNLDNAVECMKKGAFDYIVKPVEHSRFISSIKKALEINQMRQELSSLRGHVSSLKHHLLTDKLEYASAFSSILTNSKKMRAIFHYVETIAKSKEPVLIMGETGVGKELISKAIHDISTVKGEYVAVNVAGLDDTLFSDTLFGHKKGAFTGADKEREGIIVKTAEGTLFLDEIGDLSEMSQVKLLRLLEEGMYYPLGSDIPEKSNVRIIASTNQDLKKSISEGKFRKDLYYRLAAIQIMVPPLRERIEDIPILLNYFIESSADSLEKDPPSKPPELITLLSNYYFSGNIRELKAMVFDAVARHKSGVLSLDCFKEFIKDKGEYIQPYISFPDQGADSIIDLAGRFPTIKEVVDHMVSEALKRSNGNQGIAASLLGITRQALNRRLRKED
jgi:DNA-binding NtrC family response regulator